MVEKTHTSGFWPSLYEPFHQLGQKVADWLAPASEAATDDASYRISVELPGVAEDDVELSIADGVITLRGEKRSERKEKGETWFFSERQYGAFSRSFRLPPDADVKKVDASMKEGVLNITIPKVAPAATASSRVKIRKG